MTIHSDLHIVNRQISLPHLFNTGQGAQQDTWSPTKWLTQTHLTYKNLQPLD